jgi:hypothetical protein
MIVDPVLFVDFDGVLHPKAVPCLDVASNGRIAVNPSVSDLFVFLPILERILEPHPEFRIVVSSSWRRHQTDNELKMFLGRLGSRMVGTTHRDKQFFCRHQEITAFCAEYAIEHWVAVDDDLPFPEDLEAIYGKGIQTRFIKTYGILGLGWPDSEGELTSALISEINAWRSCRS